ncbi:MAG TPA: purine-nucleoside phosphorylase [Vicinamibacteria bacterium]|nr:purine-nucleoside phosphorylase [Vicinamibacteria bacterium]
MSAFEEAEEAAAFIRGRTRLRPVVGLVLGSGLGAFADTLGAAARIPYGEIPHFPAATAIGHRGEMALGVIADTPVAVMNGRVHFYEGYSPEQIVFPVRVLGRFGIKVLVMTNAAGSVNVNYKPGELMIITDHVNYMGINPLIGPNDERLGPRFFDMSDAYDPRLQEVAERACAKVGMTVRRGVYIAFNGPSYETPAEIKMSRAMGADAVGMSTVPEVIAARHMGLRVLGISCITNMAAGVIKRKLDHREVLEVGEKVKAGLLDVLGRVIADAARLA